MKSIATSFAVIGLLLTLGACARQGNEQNYRVLEDDGADQFQIESEDRFDPQSRMNIVGAASFVVAQDADGRADSAEVAASTSPLADSTATDDAEPPSPSPDEDSLLGALDAADETTAAPGPEAGTILDRSGWSRVTVGSADHRVRHKLVYWRDCTIDDTTIDVLAEPTVEARISAAMSHNRARNYHRTNIEAAFVQPVKMAADTALFPYYIVRDGHPWTETTSPTE